MSETENKYYWAVLKDEKQRDYLMKWYRNLHGLDENNQPSDKTPPQRGTRAELKRCTDINEAMMQRGFLNLSNGLRELDKFHLEGLAVVAVIPGYGLKTHQGILSQVCWGRPKKVPRCPFSVSYVFNAYWHRTA
ncbi:MAG: hypothetical protein R3F02_19285 [Thiolinea sp.]